ncbi:class I SAM-dependent methyltransferase [Brevibacillus sp. 179-C9.3 HS]|uniref:class I SAM-dependent methyltransferase n=1 Tax=unclassified Brevibacillus TaxID=2684853 RepID=UPI0039A19D64
MRKEQAEGVYEQVGVAMTCRSYQEYVDMFSLTEEVLSKGSILDVGAGASSFTAVLCQQGREAIAVDPLYQMSPEAIDQKGKQEIEESTQKLAGIAHTLDWSYYGSLEKHRKIRETSLVQFIHAFMADEPSKIKYVPGLLPDLPFADNQFSLVVGSHFLFLYPKLPQLMEEVHRLGHAASLEPTRFRFLVGATHYLEIRK